MTCDSFARPLGSVLLEAKSDVYHPRLIAQERRVLYRIVVFILVAGVVATVGCTSSGGLTGGEPTIRITNKITTLPAGQSHAFDVAQHPDSGAGFAVSLSGQGTVAPAGQTVTYLAPSAPPTPDSVTVIATAANGSGLSDSNTFRITPAAGPVVSIAPASFSATAGGPAVTLTVTVTQDSAADLLTGGASDSPDCSGACGSLGPFSGDPGGGTYTVEYSPPAGVTQTTQQQVKVFSSLAASTNGWALVTITP